MRGVPAGHHYGPSTLAPDRRTLCLVLFSAPRAAIDVRGLVSRVRRVTAVGSGTGLAHQVAGGLHGTPGVLWIEPPAPADLLDPQAPVLAVELDGELEPYRGAGRC